MKDSTQLDCSAFEYLMLSQDFIAYPCVIFLRMEIHGRLRRSEFIEAVDQMIHRHPLFRSRIQIHRGKLRWLIQPKSDHVVQWRSVDTPTPWPTPSKIDLTVQTGLLVDVEEYDVEENDVEEYIASHDNAPRARVFFQFHHAVADGLGVIAAIHDLWLVYDSLCVPNASQLPKLAPEALPLRNRFGLSPRKLLKLIPNQLIGLAGVRQYLMRKPVPLLPMSNKAFPSSEKTKGILSPTFEPTIKPTITPSTPMDCVTTVSHRFTVDVSERLKQAIKPRKVSLNDLIAASIFQSCNKLRESLGLQANTEWIRMMVPVNMRSSREDQTQTACNIVSSIFLDRTPSQISDLEVLVQSIHKEMALIKNNRLEFMFIFSIWIRKLLTFRPDRSVYPKRCQTSVVFSNLGKLFLRSPLLNSEQILVAGSDKADTESFRKGEIKMQSFEILAPLTPYMYAAFTAITYGKQLTLTMRYDDRVFSEKNAQDLLDCTVIQLEQYASESLAS